MAAIFAEEDKNKSQNIEEKRLYICVSVYTHMHMDTEELSAQPTSPKNLYLVTEIYLLYLEVGEAQNC